MLDRELADRLERARGDLRTTMAQARASLENARRTLPPTREETREFHESALRGDLGRDMQELARRVEERQTSWEDVFAGSSPHVELLREHLDAMGERYVAQVRRSLEEDPLFDPTATSPGV